MLAFETNQLIKLSDGQRRFNTRTVTTPIYRQKNSLYCDTHSGILFNTVQGLSYGNSIVQGLSYGNSIVQELSYGNSMVQGLSYGNSIVQGSSYGNSIVQRLSYDNSIVQGLSYGNSIVQGLSYGNSIKSYKTSFRFHKQHFCSPYKAATLFFIFHFFIFCGFLFFPSSPKF